MSNLEKIRDKFRSQRHVPEQLVVEELINNNPISKAGQARVLDSASKIVKKLRAMDDPGLMESFLAEYGLSTDEGVALMCLAEAYLRTPDTQTMDALIRDKIGEGEWSRHRGGADSPLVNVSTWALMLSGKVFRNKDGKHKDVSGLMLGVVQRLGEPVARVAVGQAMKLMGKQFVLGRDINEAIENGNSYRKKGYSYSYDMLGEAARTGADAQKYFLAYSGAISEIAKNAKNTLVHENPGISIKLSALHPRYEYVQHQQVMHELVPKLAALLEQARAANIAINIDAEEMDRLDISLDIIEQALRSPSLIGWDGFGVVVQAYSKQAPYVLDWLYELASDLDRKIAVRLVKGAYWDTEIKLAQVMGHRNYPLFTRKQSTDLSYVYCAKKLLDYSDRIYPQFATHNARTVSEILELADDSHEFEFQRLHGMGEALHAVVKKTHEKHCRIYAPVGVHKDLLAYLVRRLLENGANSSFVNQVLNHDVKAEDVVANPLGVFSQIDQYSNSRIPLPHALFGSVRLNSRGINLLDPIENNELDHQMNHWRNTQWSATSLIPRLIVKGKKQNIISPVDERDHVAEFIELEPSQIELVFDQANKSFTQWASIPVEQRAKILTKAADLLEENTAELIAIATREAGKTRLDGILEIREAVDFLRYYSVEAQKVVNTMTSAPIGTVVCISPWNFPLAIFIGQISAALVMGNSVIAKPAQQTPLMAYRATQILHEAGVPKSALCLVLGGASVGAALTGSPSASGVWFTGSTGTAQHIDRAMAKTGKVTAPLVAETGGLNTMIVDSSALAEQVVRDVVQSAFQSAGQRCSALRLLVVQEDVVDHLLVMLEGAMKELVIGDGWYAGTDVGPIIDKAAQEKILDYMRKLDKEGRCIFKASLNQSHQLGNFVPPAAYRLDKISDLTEEIFGPVLHVVTYSVSDLHKVVDQINQSGYGLTLGVHSRVDERMDEICDRAHAGNIYLNRNQIGAVVGVQPFGGDGLSGTGPKAGGPSYLYRLANFQAPVIDEASSIGNVIAALAQSTKLELKTIDVGPQLLEGPTGERNTYLLEPRGNVLCLGSGPVLALQLVRVLLSGNHALVLSENFKAISDAMTVFIAEHHIAEKLHVSKGDLPQITENETIDLVMFDGGDIDQARTHFASLNGARVPFIGLNSSCRLLFSEKSISEDTTASGGNAKLLASLGDPVS